MTATLEKLKFTKYIMINWEVKNMKKLTAFLSAMALGLSVAPMAAFAETSNDTISVEIQMGDVNCDGRIDASDATLVLHCYTLMISDVDFADIPYYDNIMKYGDMTGNGYVDAADASIILKKYTEYASTTTDGDINLDGVVDVTDACLVLKYYSSSLAGYASADIPYYDNIVKSGDVNGDGFIDGSDASVILQIYEARTGDQDYFNDYKSVDEYLKDKGII